MLEHRRLDDFEQGHVTAGGPRTAAGKAQRRLKLGGLVRHHEKLAPVAHGPNLPRLATRRKSAGPEAHDLLDLGQGRRGNFAGAGGTGVQHPVDLGGVR